MKVYRRAFLLALVLSLALLAGCGMPAASHSSPMLTATPANTPQPGTFYFTTDDGVTLNGQLFGQGKTAIIFSNGKEVPMLLWDPIAETLANRGYLAMTYDYRGLGQSQGWDDPDLREHDLRAAVVAAHAHGATRIVLIGSSFGGLLTAKLAVETQAEAIVMLSSPPQDGEISVSNADLRAITVPKLFMASSGDSIYAADVQQMFALVSQPKQLYLYPGKWHGVDILNSTSDGPDAMKHLIAFLNTYAPA